MQIKHALLMLVLLYTNLQLIISSFVQHSSERIDPYYFGSHFLSFYLNQIDNTTKKYTNANETLIMYQKPLGKTYSKISSLSIVLSCYIQLESQYYSFDVSAYYLTDPTSVVHVDLAVSQVYSYAILKFSTIFVCESFSPYLKFIQFQLKQPVYLNQTLISIDPGASRTLFFIKGMKLLNWHENGPYTQAFVFCNQFRPGILNITVQEVYQDKHHYLTGYCILLYTSLLGFNRQFILIQNDFFNIDYMHYPQRAFILRFNISNVGTDFNKRCILGLYGTWVLQTFDTIWLYDLDPKIGFINPIISTTQQILQFSNNLCLQDYQCPNSHPYKMGNKSCYDCSQGHIYSKQMINNTSNFESVISAFLNLHNNFSQLQIQYSYTTGEILSVCSALRLNQTNNNITKNQTNNNITGDSNQLYIFVWTVGFCLIFVVMFFLICYFCFKKVYVRKQFKYECSKDIIFQT